MNIDEQNDKVAYNDEAHQYWNVDDNENYISVTTLIDRYTQDFNKDFWSKYKALEALIPTEFWKIEKKHLLDTMKIDNKILELYSITEDAFKAKQQDILDEWYRKNKESTDRGTKIHAELEQSIRGGGDNISLQKYGIGGKFKYSGSKGRIDESYGVYPEYLIYRESPDKVLRIAGHIDLLVKDNNDITIIDYKGLPLDTEILTINGWSTIGNVKEGDTIFDGDGNPTKILHKSTIHNNPCYKITFDNGDSIISDIDHRWEIAFKKQSKKIPYNKVVMTTKEIFDYMQSYDRNSYTIPKILNPNPINTSKKDLLIDPYLLGVWLGDGSKDCGIITQSSKSKLWEELKRRGFDIGENAQHNPDREGTEMRTVYGLRTLLGKLNLLKNKHIPDDYYTASIEQRLDLLRGLMDTDGYYHPKRKRFVMSTGQEWQRDDIVKLLGTLGIKSTVFEVTKKFNGKSFIAWDICFSTNGLNPFLIRNQEIEFPEKDKNSFRNITKIELTETVPTQCLEVDSPLHTFLVTDKCIITHNTNASIDKKSGFNVKTKKNQMMKYPLSNLMDCNFYHYTMQLSTYAWMVQQLNPEFNIKSLILVHFPHEGGMVEYHLDYLKDEVEKMLRHYKKEIIQNKQKQKRQRIEF